MTSDEIPQELKDMFFRVAGTETHTSGWIMDAFAAILTRYDEIRTAQIQDAFRHGLHGEWNDDLPDHALQSQNRAVQCQDGGAGQPGNQHKGPGRNPLGDGFWVLLKGLPW